MVMPKALREYWAKKRNKGTGRTMSKKKGVRRGNRKMSIATMANLGMDAYLIVADKGHGRDNIGHLGAALNPASGLDLAGRGEELKLVGEGMALNAWDNAGPIVGGWLLQGGIKALLKMLKVNGRVPKVLGRRLI